MSKLVNLLILSSICALAQGQDGQDWRSAIQVKLLSQYTLTKATADKSSIVTAGSVIVLKKDDLVLGTTANQVHPASTYANGIIKAGFIASLGKSAKDGTSRTFVAGEKFWLTRITFEPKGDGVVLEFLTDAFDGTRYTGTLKFPLIKGSPPTPDDFAKTVAQVIRVDDSVAEAAPAAQPAPVQPAADQAAPPPVEAQVVPLAPISPPPPPADQPPPTVSLGQTKDQVVANFGQPTRIANLGPKQILYYKDFKVTLTNGKVSDVQ